MSDELEYGMGGLDDPADADTDALLTNGDVLPANGDVLQTNGDVLPANGDVLQTNDTAVATGTDEPGHFTNDVRSEGAR